MRKWIVAYNPRSNGLGNRVRMTLGARNLSQHLGRKLFVVWPTSQAFRPRFDQLWKNRLGTALPLQASQILSARFPYRDRHLTDIEATDSPVIQIRTGGILELPPGVRDWEEDLRELDPVDEIANEVAEVHGRFRGEPYVGVQIRTHEVSHEKTKIASPLSWYETRMNDILARQPEMRFFISCDVAEVQQQFMMQFPSALGLREKGGYNTVRGVQSAVSDLYLLAASGFILGPAYSSFVQLAVRLAAHKISFETSTKDQMFAPDLLSTVSNPMRPLLRHHDQDG